MTYVYLMSDGYNHKIGKSKDPEKRARELTTANPNIRLVAYSSVVIEKNVHKLFEHKRLAAQNGRKSEWFDLNEDDISIILKLFETGEAGNEDPNQQFRKDLTWGSGQEAILHGNYHYGNRVKKMRKYRIGFGKYKGKKIIDMQNEEEIEYIKWFINEFNKKPQPSWLKPKWARNAYNTFCWWIGELRNKDFRAIRRHLDEGVNEC